MHILALTSNDYVNVLPGFAYLFNKFYGVESVTVVRYDVRPPKLPDNFKNFAVGKQSDYSWSGGLKYYLSQIEDEFVLLMLEDYYLDKPVDKNRITFIKYFMQDNKNIAKVDLTDDRLKVDYKLYNDNPINGLIESNLKSPFLSSVQAAIWRKDFLEAVLNTKDNAWQFEKNKRTKTYLEKTKSVVLGCANPPMSYINAVGGEGNNPGVYDLKKFPQWMVDELKTNGVYNG